MNSVPARGFSVTSYNVLASAYVSPERYPDTPAALLDDRERIPALVRYISAFDTDVICLQEVERHALIALEAALAPLGYAFQYAPKARGQPDGCATFLRHDSMLLRNMRVMSYADGGGHDKTSGHICLVTVLEHAGHRLAIANTHLKWDSRHTPKEDKKGLRQIAQLLAERETLSPGCDAWIICGDFNAEPDSEIVAALRASDFEHAHCRATGAYTCNSHRKAKLLDYLFHTRTLRATPVGFPDLKDHTPLPSCVEPSDHLPVIAKFVWT